MTQPGSRLSINRLRAAPPSCCLQVSQMEGLALSLRSDPGLNREAKCRDEHERVLHQNERCDESHVILNPSRFSSHQHLLRVL